MLNYLNSSVRQEKTLAALIWKDMKNLKRLPFRNIIAKMHFGT